MSKLKPRRDNKTILQITLVAMGLILLVFLLTSITSVKEYPKPSAPNYLGLANLGLIPTTNTCSYNDAKVYTSTGIIGQVNEKQYLILESKLGNEYCPIRIS
jgi:hypothetical protein